MEGGKPYYYGGGTTVLVDMFPLLIEKGANVNARDSNGDTALIIAAAMG